MPQTSLWMSRRIEPRRAWPQRLCSSQSLTLPVQGGIACPQGPHRACPVLLCTVDMYAPALSLASQLLTDEHFLPSSVRTPPTPGTKEMLSPRCQTESVNQSAQVPMQVTFKILFQKMWKKSAVIWCSNLKVLSKYLYGYRILWKPKQLSVHASLLSCVTWVIQVSRFKIDILLRWGRESHLISLSLWIIIQVELLYF